MRRPLGLLLALLLAGAAAAPSARAADATVIAWGESLRNVILAGSGAPGTAATRLEPHA
jgi:hypothetical protein